MIDRHSRDVNSRNRSGTRIHLQRLQLRSLLAATTSDHNRGSNFEAARQYKEVSLALCQHPIADSIPTLTRNVRNDVRRPATDTTTPRPTLLLRRPDLRRSIWQRAILHVEIHRRKQSSTDSTTAWPNQPSSSSSAPTTSPFPHHSRSLWLSQPDFTLRLLLPRPQRQHRLRQQRQHRRVRNRRRRRSSPASKQWQCPQHTVRKTD